MGDIFRGAAFGEPIDVRPELVALRLRIVKEGVTGASSLRLCPVLEQRDRRIRAVVLSQHPGCGLSAAVARSRLGIRRLDLQSIRTDWPRAQNPRHGRIAQIDDSGFHSVLTGTAVEHRGDTPAQRSMHMRSQRRADIAKGIRARRSEGEFDLSEQFAEDWVPRHADRHAW